MPAFATASISLNVSADGYPCVQEKIARKRNASPAIPIPNAIFFGVEISRPRRVKYPKKSMMSGVSTITKNGLIACHISGAILSVCTKSRAK